MPLAANLHNSERSSSWNPPARQASFRESLTDRFVPRSTGRLHRAYRWAATRFSGRASRHAHDVQGLCNDVSSGQLRWSTETAAHMLANVTATVSGVVFAGDLKDALYAVSHDQPEFRPRVRYSDNKISGARSRLQSPAPSRGRHFQNRRSRRDLGSWELPCDCERALPDWFELKRERGPIAPLSAIRR